MLCDCDCDCNNPCGLCSRCDNCNECNSAQTLCKSSQAASSQPGGSYSFGPFERDDIINDVMPLSVFNDMGKAVVRISNIGNRGISGTKGGGKVSNSSASWTDQISSFVSAKKTNELVELINDVGGGITPKSQFVSSQGEIWPSEFIAGTSIVYGSYFQAIASAINNCKLDPGACDACNSGCNALCLTCDSCNNCQASCQTDDNSGGSGCDCDCDSPPSSS